MLNEGAQQDCHGPHPTCWEVRKDDSLYHEVLESLMTWQDLMALFRQAIIHQLSFSFSLLFLS